MTTTPEVLPAFVRRMDIACDRTRAVRGKDEVAVETSDWHALMDLANAARKVASTPITDASAEVRAREVLLGILREVAEPEDIIAAEAGEWRSVQLTGEEAIRAMLSASPQAPAVDSERLREALIAKADEYDKLAKVNLAPTSWEHHAKAVTYREIAEMLVTSAESENSAAIPAGMKAWHGGDSAPEDWDGGPVLMQDGRTIPAEHVAWWDHGTCDDIIAYTPAPPSQEQSGPVGDGE